MKTYKVNEVAKLTGVTVRALHHYDELGLLVPTTRTKSGYRLYSEADLLRLQQILIHRELGFPLRAIKDVLDAPDFDVRSALLRQRGELEKRRREVSRMVAAVDAALASLDGGPIDMKVIFGGFDPEDYAEEAEARWGGGEPFQESERRMRGYDRSDLAKLKAEQDVLFRRMAEALRGGSAPQSKDACAVAEAHRLYIDRWFYPCSHQAHAALAELYVGDERFMKTFDAYEPGLAEFFAAAIRANVAGG